MQVRRDDAILNGNRAGDMLLDGFHAGGFALAALAAVLIGVAKTGVPGFGILVVPLMVLAVGDARQSAGWLLPLLCVADVSASTTGGTRRRGGCFTWRRGCWWAWVRARWRWRPRSATCACWWRDRPGDDRPALAARARRGRTCRRPPAPGDRSLVAGGWLWRLGGVRDDGGQRGGAGHEPLPARAAAAQTRVRRDRRVVLLAVNLSAKLLPIYAGHALIDRRSLTFDLALVPAVLVGAFVGRVVLTRIPQATFDKLVMALTVGAAVLLLVPR